MSHATDLTTSSGHVDQPSPNTRAEPLILPEARLFSGHFMPIWLSLALGGEDSNQTRWALVLVLERMRIFGQHKGLAGDQADRESELSFRLVQNSPYLLDLSFHAGGLTILPIMPAKSRTAPKPRIAGVKPPVMMN